MVTESPVQVLPNNVEKMTWCLIMHEPCAVVDEEAHVQRVLVNNLSKNDGTLHLLGKTTGPKS
jgi:hypothetical protein